MLGPHLVSKAELPSQQRSHNGFSGGCGNLAAGGVALTSEHATLLADAEPSRKERGHRGVRPRHPNRGAKSEPGRVPQAARNRVDYVQADGTHHVPMRRAA
jgi:hypothetical protein